MSNLIAMWLGVTLDYRDQIFEYLAWDTESQGEYTGPLVATDEAIFSTLDDVVLIQTMYKIDSFAGEDWFLFPIYLPEPEIDDVIDWLAANKGSKTKILGVWEYDTGIQYGQEIEPETGDVIGDPTYPIDLRTIEFMPDIIERDENGNIISTTPATELSDINKIQGQADRAWD